MAASLWERFGRKEVLEKCKGIFMASVRGFDRNAGLKRRPDLETWKTERKHVKIK